MAARRRLTTKLPDRPRTAEEKAFERGVLMALWVPAWADAFEEGGGKYPPGSRRLEEIAPSAPLSAKKAAREFTRVLEKLNARKIGEIIWRAEDAEGRAVDPEALGYYLTMPSLGHGVSWTDDHPAFDVRLPSIEAYASKAGRGWDLSVSGLEDPERLARALRDPARGGTSRGLRGAKKRSSRVIILPVIFRAEKSGDHKGEVTAVFPTQQGTGPRDFTVYAHTGQHGTGTHGWYQQRTRPAKPAEYAPLLRELRQIYEQGEDRVRLKVYSRFTREMDDARHQSSDRWSS